MSTQLKKQILRKEYFGGIFMDTNSGSKLFLNHEEYVSKKTLLKNTQKKGSCIKFFDVTEKGLPLLRNAASSPIDIYFELTKRCNASCKDCFMNANSPQYNLPEISLSEIEPIIRQFSNYGGFYIRLTGGEPTIRKDFFDIVDLINEEGIVIGLNSNGLFGEKKLKKILSREIKDIRISLDGPEKINDKIRGKGTYKRITRTLNDIANYNRYANNPVKLTINVVLMRSNMHSIEKMIELALNYGAKISFGLLRLTGRANITEMLTPEEVVLSTLKVQNLRKILGFPKSQVRINYDILCERDTEKNEFSPFPFDNSKCPIGSSGISIDAYANLMPCGYFANINKWLGENVKGKDLVELWHHSHVLKEARAVNRPGCAKCHYHKVKCNGGCPMMAYVFEGDIDGKDPYCVRDVNMSNLSEFIRS